MLEFRKNLLDNILNAEEIISIEPLIRESLKRMVANGTNTHLIARFVQRLDADLKQELTLHKHQKEIANIQNAMEVIKEINFNDFSTVKTN